jgi:hypothetical protein
MLANNATSGSEKLTGLSNRCWHSSAPQSATLLQSDAPADGSALLAGKVSPEMRARTPPR